MKPKQKALLKDKILAYFITNEHSSVEDASERLNIEYDVLHSLIQELIDSELLTLNAKLASKKRYSNNDMSVLINPQGRYFLNHNGGNIAEYRKYIKKRVWLTTKIVAGILNALLIVCISIWGIQKSNISRQSEEKIESLEKEILKHQNEIQFLREHIEQTKNDSIK